MGPRHCCRGIHKRKRPVCGRGTGFNGAAALLPRNLCALGRALSRVRRFNGAAALLPRNRADNRRTATAQAASMGPRHCCRGIGHARCAAAPGLRASMGPRHCCRGIQGWVCAERDVGAASMGPRHCCRGIDGGDADPPPAFDWASMGPRHCCRGIRPTPRRIEPATASLQWGRGIAAAESSERRCSTIVCRRLLQWGRGIAAAESHQSQARIRMSEF